MFQTVTRRAAKPGFSELLSKKERDCTLTCKGNIVARLELWHLKLLVVKCCIYFLMTAIAPFAGKGTAHFFWVCPMSFKF